MSSDYIFRTRERGWYEEFVRDLKQIRLQANEVINIDCVIDDITELIRHYGEKIKKITEEIGE